MRTRHRIPTIFNLSMVDVLCCALGCVILLWLVNFREAKRRAAAAGETNSLLAETRSQLDEVRSRLGAADSRLREAASERDALTTESARLRDELASARGRAADLGKDIAALKMNLSTAEDLLSKKSQEYLALAKDRDAAEDRLTKKTLDFAALLKEKTAAEDRLVKKSLDFAALLKDKDAAEDRLSKKSQEYLTLVKEKDAAARQVESQQKLLREKETLALAATRAADDIAARLRESELRARGLAEEMPKLREKLSTAEGRLTTLQKDLGEQKVLTQQAIQARLAAENRFAGIALTGRRVVFLVDMSGSMDYVDEKTLAPDKWKGVRDSLVKIMRSLPELEKFQVVLFSDRASFLLGNDDRWINYDPKTSPDRITEALAAIKPKGNTNMFAAFEAAFRFRGDGLDTIYLLSDGLPNIGEGLTLEQGRKLGEVERSGILSQYVLRTLRTAWNRPAVDRSRVRINAVGFFYESPDVGAFLWALARENDGSFVGMSKP
jgi:hypothetical protein